MHLNSRLLFEKYAVPLIQPGMRVLEIGPDRFPSTLRSCVKTSSIQWLTMDMYDSERLDFTNLQPYQFPIPDESFDIVVSANVAEHVQALWKWMPEVARVCSRGGRVVTINPVSYPYHEAPIDCWRIYPEGMRAVYAEAGLTVEHSSFECLEVSQNRRRLPGVSTSKQSAARRFVWSLLGLGGFPVECAFDAVTVGIRN
ncbi:MAG: class I SAM-dependent methyltransferase [Planctomyces sp.]|jgi:SAM-dependent methyltransferase